MMGEGAPVDVAPLVVVVNAAIVGVALVGAGAFLGARALTSGVPEGRQNVGEFVLDFFVRKARDMSHGLDRARVVRDVAPFLGTCFLLIFVSNLFGMLPLPVLNRPPTSYFSVTLALALCSVAGTLVLSAVFKGPGGALKHLFWPNPMQWVSEFTDVVSLSLRLFGNIGGEYMTFVLVAAIVPFGIPLILHVVGLIPAFVQALVFTLLTASFLASAIHKEERAARTRRRWFARRSSEPAAQS
jgi:F-type H+-transporting ATPase subunit a